MHNIFTITTNIQADVKIWKFHGKGSPLELLKKILEKYLTKSSQEKVAGSKNEFIHTYFSRLLLKILITFVHDFWDNYVISSR